MSAPVIEYFTVKRTARFAMLGSPGTARDVWFVCHGYGQLAADFVGLFQPLDDGSRLLVAPEGLSRFYVGGGRGRVGASWMTREDRDHEMGDYLEYLDRLYAHVLSDVPDERRTVRALGFSQGVATACRWAARGGVRFDHLILWAERLPPEYDSPERCEHLRTMRLTTVFGTRDEYLTGDAMAAHRERLAGLDLTVEELTFEGGHRLDRATLKRLGGEEAEVQHDGDVHGDGGISGTGPVPDR